MAFFRGLRTMGISWALGIVTFIRFTCQLPGALKARMSNFERALSHWPSIGDFRADLAR
jgi:hypothetical protein